MANTVFPKVQHDWLKHELDCSLFRRAGTVKSGSGLLVSGQVLGRIATDAGGTATAAAKSGGNTGNGAITLDATTPVLAGAVSGVYQVRAVANAFTAAVAAVAGNTGNGVATIHTTTTAAGVVAGVYRATCIEAAANGGRFAVADPAGVIIGTAIVGTLFDGVVKFTIADGATDFVAGDAFAITVTAVNAANAGTFQVTSPAGAVLGTYTIGGAAFATGIKFTIADGATDFVVGDGFDVTVALGTQAGKYVPVAPAAVDGSQTAAAIVVDPADATSADVEIAILTGNAQIVGSQLTWTAGMNAGQKTAALAQLAALGIVDLQRL